MSTNHNELIGRSPRALTGVNARGLKNWRSTPGQPGRARKIRKNRKKTSPPPYPTLLEAVSPSLLHNRNVHDSGDELNLRHTTVEETNVAV